MLLAGQTHGKILWNFLLTRMATAISFANFVVKNCQMSTITVMDARSCSQRTSIYAKNVTRKKGIWRRYKCTHSTIDDKVTSIMLVRISYDNIIPLLDISPPYLCFLCILFIAWRVCRRHAFQQVQKLQVQKRCLQKLFVLLRLLLSLSLFVHVQFSFFKHNGGRNFIKKGRKCGSSCWGFKCQQILG